MKDKAPTSAHRVKRFGVRVMRFSYEFCRPSAGGFARVLVIPPFHAGSAMEPVQRMSLSCNPFPGKFTFPLPALNVDPSKHAEQHVAHGLQPPWPVAVEHPFGSLLSTRAAMGAKIYGRLREGRMSGPETRRERSRLIRTPCPQPDMVQV